jgi:hypothetical protein
MTEALNRRSSAFIGFCGTVLAACVLFLAASPPQADAYWDPYCNNWILNKNGVCTGAARTYNATSAYGERGGVCTSSWKTDYSQWDGWLCAGGAYQTVYNPHEGGAYWYAFPSVRSEADSNTVHASAWKCC